MEAPKAIQPAPAHAPRPEPLPLPSADDLPPWERDRAEPSAAAGVALRSRPAAKHGDRRAAAFEAVHWSIVVLTALTALSILTGSYRSEPSRPRELLPIVMAAP